MLRWDGFILAPSRGHLWRRTGGGALKKEGLGIRFLAVDFAQGRAETASVGPRSASARGEIRKVTGKPATRAICLPLWCPCCQRRK